MSESTGKGSLISRRNRRAETLPVNGRGGCIRLLSELALNLNNSPVRIKSATMNSDGAEEVSTNMYFDVH